MNKILMFLILYISLFFIETFFSFFIYLFYHISTRFDIFDSIEVAVFWNLIRYLYFSLPFILLYYLFFRYVRKINLYKPFLFSLFNLLINILFSLLTGNFLGGDPLPLALDPFKLLFWLSCIPIIVSPLVLAQVPYHKKLMSDL